MRNSARRRESGWIGSVAVGALTAGGAAIARNPLMVGGATGFLVALFYVSANALWYQPHRHPEPLLQTRALIGRTLQAPPRPEPRPIPTVRQPVSVSDPKVEKVQVALADLGFYAGSIDGIAGPQTRRAIEDFQRKAGLGVSGEINDRLLDELVRRRSQQAANRTPGTTARSDADLRTAAVSRESALPHTTVVKVQAGLRAFGHEGIEIDGILGEKTRQAIREFQSFFKLPVTGEVDARLLAKMKEIGLTDGG